MLPQLVQRASQGSEQTAVGRQGRALERSLAVLQLEFIDEEAEAVKSAAEQSESSSDISKLAGFPDGALGVGAIHSFGLSVGLRESLAQMHECGSLACVTAAKSLARIEKRKRMISKKEIRTEAIEINAPMVKRTLDNDDNFEVVCDGWKLEDHDPSISGQRALGWPLAAVGAGWRKADAGWYPFRGAY